MTLIGISAIITQGIFNSVWQGVIIFFLIRIFFRFNKRLSAAARYRFNLAALIIILVISFTSSAIFTKGDAIYNYGDKYIDVNSIKKRITIDDLKPDSPDFKRTFLHDRPLFLKYNPFNFIEFNTSDILPDIPVIMNMIITFAWIIISILLMIRLAVSYIYSIILRRSSLPVKCKTALTLSGNTEKDDLTRYDIRSSKIITVPVTLGFFNPQIIIPENLLKSLKNKELHNIILHEAGHLKRFDIWTNLLQRMIEAVMFFNPAVFFINKKLDLEREIACDELVIKHKKNSKQYAQCLLDLSDKVDFQNNYVLSIGAIRSSGHLKKRIIEIMKFDPRKQGRPSIPKVIILVFITSFCLTQIYNIAPFFRIVDTYPFEKPVNIEDVLKLDEPEVLAEVFKSALAAHKKPVIKTAEIDNGIRPYLGTWLLTGFIDGKKETFLLCLKRHLCRTLVNHKANSFFSKTITTGYFISKKFGVQGDINLVEFDKNIVQFHFSPSGPGYPVTVLAARLVILEDKIYGGWDYDNKLSPNHPVRVSGTKLSKENIEYLLEKTEKGY